MITAVASGPMHANSWHVQLQHEVVRQYLVALHRAVASMPEQHVQISTEMTEQAELL